MGIFLLLFLQEAVNTELTMLLIVLSGCDLSRETALLELKTKKYKDLGKKKKKKWKN